VSQWEHKGKLFGGHLHHNCLGFFARRVRLTDARMMRVGCWPGTDFGNAFITRFCDGLRLAGIHVESIESPLHATIRSIDIFHIHWPEMVFWSGGRLEGMRRSLFTLVSLAILRLKGVRIVWTVHNIEPHDKGDRFSRFWRLYILVVSFFVDGFITLSPSTIHIVRNRLAKLASRPGTFLWHPNYLIPESLADQRQQIRAGLGIEPTHKVFGFIGQIRPYKGVEELVECFRKIEDPNSRLLIAGAVYDERLKSKLALSASADKRIILHSCYLSEDQFARVAISADVIVLPFRKVFHSGSMIYALSAGKPVITPSTPFAIDLFNQVGDIWLRHYDDVLTPEDLLSIDIELREKPDLSFLSIAESSVKAKAFYESLR
jgi:beta-1,4-mannosyltransferase